ncbi:unnamed protein product [Lampetra fluviatilis]
MCPPRHYRLSSSLDVNANLDPHHPHVLFSQPEAVSLVLTKGGSLDPHGAPSQELPVGPGGVGQRGSGYLPKWNCTVGDG